MSCLGKKKNCHGSESQASISIAGRVAGGCCSHRYDSGQHTVTDDLVPRRMPWEPVPVAEQVDLLKADVAYMVTHTCVVVRSNREELRLRINTPRGQIVPRGECKFSDGTTIEYQDLGMPQPGAPEMTVDELTTRVWKIAASLGLEL